MELRGFRSGFFRALTGWADANFESCEALLCSPGPVASTPTLSLDPVFRRSHGSLYKGLNLGQVDGEAMRDLLVAHRPGSWPLVFAVDESVWPRNNAETSPQRGFYHSSSKQWGGQPIVAGWSYQWIAQLDWALDSWTAPMDAARIPPGADKVDATAKQIRALTGRLERQDPGGPAPVFVFDAGYDPIALTSELSCTRACLVVRIRNDRVFYTDPPEPRPGRPGRPPRHGHRRCCADPATWPDPDQQLTAQDPRHGTVHVAAWHNLHPMLARRGHWADRNQAPIIPGTVVRVDVEHLPKAAGGPNKTLWLWVAADQAGEADLDIWWRAYLRQFDIEHTFRFVKTTLGWTTPRLRTPEQADRWTWLILAAHTQLRLARPLVEDHRLPWQRPARPGRLTPGRVRQGFRRTTPIRGTPASPPKTSRAGPGRPKGTKTGPRERHPALHAAEARV